MQEQEGPGAWAESALGSGEQRPGWLAGPAEAPRPEPWHAIMPASQDFSKAGNQGH